jgi:aminomethyltransferase
MTEFGGWEMPVQYGSLIQEHQAVRTHAGLFDISHMGKFVLRGTGILEQLQGLVPSDLSGLKPGKAQYTVLLNEQAGILDDLILYPQTPEVVVVIVNAATCDKDKAWLQSHLDSAAIELEDLTQSCVLLALQGPKSSDILQGLLSQDLSQIKRFGHAEMLFQGEPVFMARTGYTGEDGFEIMLAVEAGKVLWQHLLDHGVMPCGLGARDTLRLEAAMSLYGQDMDETTTPLESGLGWLVHLDRKGPFMGRSILEQQKQEGVKRQLIGLEMEGRHIARHGYPVLAHDGLRSAQPIGIITSGSWSPTLQKAIALASVPPEFAQIGQSLAVEIRGKACPGTVVKRPFYRSIAFPEYL